MNDTKTQKDNSFELEVEDIQEKSFKYGIRHIQMLSMCLCTVGIFIARSSMGVAILAMTDYRRANDTQIEIYQWDKNTQGIVLSSFFWGYLCMQIPAGLLAKKYGGKPIFIASLLSNAFICLIIPLMAKLGGWQLVCACRVMMGLTQACLFPATHTLLGKWAPEQERTTFGGIVYGGTQIGTIIAMPLSGYLADTAMGWKLIFYSISGLLFSVTIVYYFTTASTPRQHKWISIEERDYIESGFHKVTSDLAIPWKKILTTRQIYGIAAAQTGLNFSFTVFFVDLPTFLEMGLGISLKSSASISALPYIGMWAVGVAAGGATDYIVNKNILTLSICRKIMNGFADFGGAICLVALCLVNEENKLLAVAALVLTISISGFCTAGYMCNHLDLSPNFAGVMLSLTNFVSSMGAISAPIITSTVLNNDPTDISRWRIVFLITGGILTVAQLIYMLLANSDRQEWDDPSYMDKEKADLEETQPMSKKENPDNTKASSII